MKLLITTLLACTILLSGCSQATSSDNLESSTSTISSSTYDTSSDESELEFITSEKEITQTDTPPTKTDKAVKIPQGMYKVGSEILAGEYLIIPESGDRSSYVEVSADSTGKSIVTNENVKTFFFVSVLDGQYLTVKNGTLTNTAELGSLGDILDFSEGYHQGHYRVGIDMPAGEYKITPYEGASTYYEVSKDSFGKSIITNDNIKSQSYITVSDGQYLKFSRAVATKVD